MTDRPTPAPPRTSRTPARPPCHTTNSAGCRSRRSCAPSRRCASPAGSFSAAAPDPPAPVAALAADAHRVELARRIRPQMPEAVAVGRRARPLEAKLERILLRKAAQRLPARTAMQLVALVALQVEQALASGIRHRTLVHLPLALRAVPPKATPDGGCPAVESPAWPAGPSAVSGRIRLRRFPKKMPCGLVFAQSSGRIIIEIAISSVDRILFLKPLERNTRQLSSQAQRPIPLGDTFRFEQRACGWTPIAIQRPEDLSKLHETSLHRAVTRPAKTAPRAPPQARTAPPL